MIKISLQKANKTNWNFILELRNSFYDNFLLQNKLIGKKAHYKYLEIQSKNSDFHHWIIKYDDKKAGYVRILNLDVGIMIKKEFQNQGIASKALSLLEIKARILGMTKLKAQIIVKNKSSKKIFLKNNFKLSMYTLEKEL